jgi:two-component system, cell cycle sensor histidine kinase and response regulator CckA
MLLNARRLDHLQLILLVIADVTDQKHGEALRKAAEESREAANRIRLQADMLAAVGEAVIATDLEGLITYWNPAAEALYGWSRQEALGKPVLEMTPPEGEYDAMVEVFAALQEGGSWTGELDMQRRDGSTFRVRATDAPILDGDGRLIGIIGVSSDITERKHLEAQLRQAQKMEAVGRLAGGVAHDFNNLLTAVEGHASILLDDLPADSPFREDVGQILKAGERAADLTRQLLAFSHQQILQERNVDVSSIAVELDELLRRLVPARIRFQVTCSREPAVVRADPGQLHQVVMNLVVNAVDAIDEDGSITVAVEPVELDESDAAGIPWDVEPGPYVRLSVEDTGSGMPPEVLKSLFEPFFTTKQERHGTGLGLPTVYGIVKQSRGHILVESELGRGSTFRVFLPRVGAKPDPVRERPAMVSATVGGVVLLVEDDEAVRTIARRILVRAGYTVVEAASGREALDRVEDGIDLVISDVVMPDMGGPELQKRLREQYPNLKVILTSGYCEGELKGATRQLGAAFLPKPFTPESLIRCVAEVLGRSSQGG